MFRGAPLPPHSVHGVHATVLRDLLRKHRAYQRGGHVTGPCSKVEAEERLDTSTRAVSEVFILNRDDVLRLVEFSREFREVVKDTTRKTLPRRRKKRARAVAEVELAHRVTSLIAP